MSSLAYSIGQEGYVYGLTNGIARKVRIDGKVRRSYKITYLEKILGYTGQGSLFSPLDMKRHFISCEDYNPEIHK